MELKKLVKILLKNKALFFGIWLAIVALATVWFFSQPSKYEAFLSVEISRDSLEETKDYQYNQYYRLLADEKFADTVTQWSKDPEIVKTIFQEAKVPLELNSLRQASKILNGERLTANYIQIKFSTNNEERAERIITAIKNNFSKKTEELNQSSQDKNWFKLVFGDSLIVLKKNSFSLIFFASFIFGLMSAMLVVLLRHYWQEDDEGRN
jgi:uncharacterized protein involved in exopolysaccharide biosynthesis